MESSDNIEVTGMQNVTKAQIMEVMGGDIGRNIFFIPLAQQKAQLEQIPWVESASVMRFVPNRLKVEIHERTPVAFARVGPRISLIDAGGTLMDLPPKHKYSFPVILGMNPGEPLSTRAPRMKIYTRLVGELDSGGARYSQDLSEVDLSDLEDVKVRVNDPAGDVLVHLGSSDYLRALQNLCRARAGVAAAVPEAGVGRPALRQPDHRESRYGADATKQAALTPAAAKGRSAAGVKPAALVTRMSSAANAPVPKPAFELTEKKLRFDDERKPRRRNQRSKAEELKKAACEEARREGRAPSETMRRRWSRRTSSGEVSAASQTSAKIARQRAGKSEAESGDREAAR